MKKLFACLLVFALCSMALIASAEDITFAFLFQDLETEFWVASHKAITETLRGKGIKVLEYNANEDANRQLEQVKDAIAQKVNALFVIAQDADSAAVMAGVANKAGVPIGLFGRPPAHKKNMAFVATSSEIQISTAAMEHMVTEARKQPGKMWNPLIIVGDLGDINAVDRRQAFMNVYEANRDIFNDVIEVPSKWDPATCLANLQSAMQANPQVDFMFVSSDFLYPQVKAVLEPMGKWKPIGDENHVIMCGIDGDLTAGRLMDEKIVDATGVHDLFGMAHGLMGSLLDAIEKGEKTPNGWTAYPGFTLTQANMAERKMDMWGNMLRPELQ